MSTYHYDGSPCPESCTCAVREVDRLRTQLEAVTRERDGYREALEMANAAAKTNAEERDEARAAVELVREECARDIARARDEALAPCHGLGCGRCESCVGLARAEAARLREVLEDARRRIEVMGVGEQSDSVRVHNRLLNQSEDALKVIIAALASTPSAEPTRTDAERWLGDGPEAPGGTLAFHAEPTPPKCPSPSCKACIGEACDKCGKGSWNPEGPECTHDVLQRHEAPSAEPDYSGLCYAPECGGHCGYVHARGCEAIREYLADHGGDPYKAPPRAPSAEPTPRDMRVAEAVREACVETADASDEASRRVAGDLRDLDLAAVVAKAVKP